MQIDYLISFSNAAVLMSYLYWCCFVGDHMISWSLWFCEAHLERSSCTPSICLQQTVSDLSLSSILSLDREQASATLLFPFLPGTRVAAGRHIVFAAFSSDFPMASRWDALFLIDIGRQLTGAAVCKNVPSKRCQAVNIQRRVFIQPYRVINSSCHYT